MNSHLIDFCMISPFLKTLPISVLKEYQRFVNNMKPKKYLLFGIIVAEKIACILKFVKIRQKRRRWGNLKQDMHEVTHMVYLLYMQLLNVEHQT
jgi:hypothetical protein